MSGLNPNFIHKVLRNGPFTDTTKYRYFVRSELVVRNGKNYRCTVIKRIPIGMLNTTAVYGNDNYESVWHGNYQKEVLG